MVQQRKLYINGEWVEGEGKSLLSLDPGNESRVWLGYEASRYQAAVAFSHAKRALKIWRTQSLEVRLGYILNFKNQLLEHKEDLATLISKETGKPRWETLQEVSAMISKVDISVDSFKKRTAPSKFDQGDAHVHTLYKPHGILLVFGPYNFPGHLPNGHIVPALIAGNVVLFKPSELTPAVGEYMVSLWEKAGLPPGVLQLLQGGRDVGKTLVEHPDHHGLLFTGSSNTGRVLSQLFSAHPHKVLALEMGGNNPLVLSDASSDVIPLLIQSAFMSSGQRCTCMRRLIIVDTPENRKILDYFVQVVSKVSIGYWSSDDVPFMGPLISSHARDLVFEDYQQLVNSGAKVLLEMNKLDGKGYFLSPGIIDVTETNVSDHETFGPLLQVMFVQSLEEAIDVANKTSYGLSASFIGQSKEDFDQFYHSIDAGIINWNAPTNGASSKAPFGGIKGSGNHRPSAYFAADYCSYPIASVRRPHIFSSSLPGIPDV